jgi:ankyrin repeat domain-containing protein 50
MMNKFRGPEDTNFKLVSGTLKEIADNTRIAQSRTKEELKCLQCLTSNYRDDKNRNQQRVPGTCEWVLQHSKFLHWRQENIASLLWVSADPGCGKSVLSRSLVDEQLLILDNKKSSVCYFFFKDDDVDRQSGTSALCAILHQLFVQQPVLLKHAMLDYENNGEHLRTMFSTLWEILEKSAKDPEASEIICVLDALDECKESARKDLIKNLGQFYSRRNKTNMKLKFLLTGRPYENIERSFYSSINDMLSISLKGEDESEKISREIDLVIDDRIPRICKDRRFPLELEVQNALIECLKTIPHRTYLWLHLIFDIIEKSLDSSRIRLEKLIRIIPRTVEEAYEKILLNVTNSEFAAQARKLFHIVVAATRPLTSHEMNIALAIDEKLEGEESCQSYDELDLEPEMPFRNKIRNICGLFVSVVDSKIYLIHQTAKEFLISKTCSRMFTSLDNSISQNWRYSLNPVESNNLLVRICLSYLLLSGLHSSENNAGVTSFLTYAAEYWSSHFQRARIESDQYVIQTTLRLCDTQSCDFQRWFRVYWKNKKSVHHSSPDANNLMIVSYFGLEALLKLLLEKNDVDLNSKDSCDRTPLLWAVAEGHVQVVKRLLEEDSVDLNLKDNRGWTPLMWAVEMDHIEITKMLLEKKGINLNAKTINDMTPLSYAIDKERVEIVKLLLEKDNLDLNSQDGNYGDTPLILAVKQDKTEIVKSLLGKKEVNINFRNYSGRTALYCAAETNNLEITKLFLKRADVDVISFCRLNSETAISIAVYLGYLKEAKLLLEKIKLNTMSTNDRGKLLLVAILGGYSEIIKPLLETEDVDLNYRNNVGRTVLSVAAASHHYEVMELIIKHEGLNLIYKNNEGGKMLMHTARAGNYNVVKLLLEKEEVELDSKDDEYGLTALSWAAKNGYCQIVKLLMRKEGVKFNSMDITGRTPLSWAAANGHCNVVELLLDEDEVERNTTDYFSRTPLSLAAEAGHFELVRLLLTRDDDVKFNFQDHDGLKSPLWTMKEKRSLCFILSEDPDNVDHALPILKEESSQSWAARRPKLKVRDLLYENLPEDFDFMNYDNQAPISWAAREGHENVVKLFLEKDGVDFDSKDGHGRSPLSWAAEKGHVQVVEMLLDKDGVELNSKDIDHCLTPLAWATEEGHLDVIKLLLDKDGVDLNTTDHDGRTPLSWAAGEGGLEVIKLLLEKDGVELNSKDINRGSTPLAWAARRGDVRVINIFLEKVGVEVNAIDKHGLTPFAWAARERDLKAMMRFFEKSGVDLNSKDSEGLTPLAWAVRARHSKVIKLLFQRDDVELNTKDNYGRTPLSLAAENGYVEIVRLLLKKNNLEVNLGDNDGRTPLSWAVEKEHTQIIKLLREKTGV